MGKRRPNGDGTVRKRPDGRWEARIIVGHKENKKPIYKSVFGLTQAEAMAKFRKLQEVYQGVELTEDSIVTLNEWLDRCMPDAGIPPVRPASSPRILRGSAPSCQRKLRTETTHSIP